MNYSQTDSTIEIKNGNISFNKKTGNFVTEISDLGDQTPSCKMASIVTLINPVTKKKMDFILTSIDKDKAENEIQGWRYTPTKLPDAQKLGINGMLIIND